jgi:hypothetical protein
MKSKLLTKAACMLAGVAMMFGLSSANAQGGGRKVDKSFVAEMKIVDPAYCKKIKKVGNGDIMDFNEPGQAEISKKKYENQRIEFDLDQLNIPTDFESQKATLLAIPSKIEYLNKEMAKETNSVTKLELKKEIVRLQKIKSILSIKIK